jgi:hypothetical protein
VVGSNFANGTRVAVFSSIIWPNIADYEKTEVGHVTTVKSRLRGGRLRPLEPVQLDEHQPVISVLELAEDGASDTTNGRPVREVAADLVREISFGCVK